MANTLERIRDEVNKHQGVLTVNMGRLRDDYGAGRLGKHVIDGIMEELSKQGVAFVSNGPDGHLRDKLPDSQWDIVRLYLPDSPVGRLIIAAYNIDREEEGDKILRSVSGSVEIQRIQETEKEIRELRKKMDDISDILRS